MKKIRTISGCVDEIKNGDPNTAITPWAVRQAIQHGQIPYTQVGTKYLVALEDVLNWFEPPLTEGKEMMCSDSFLEMSFGAQALYFHLALRADKSGCVNDAKEIVELIGVNNEDLKLLISKELIYPWGGGVRVRFPLV